MNFLKNTKYKAYENELVKTRAFPRKDLEPLPKLLLERISNIAPINPINTPIIFLVVIGSLR